MRLIRDGEGSVWSWGKMEIIYLSLHCHHQNDSCINMGSDESYFNVSLIVRGKATRQCPQTKTFEEPKGQSKRSRTEVPLLTSLTARSNRLTIVEHPNAPMDICTYRSMNAQLYLLHCRQGKNPELTQEEHGAPSLTCD